MPYVDRETRDRYDLAVDMLLRELVGHPKVANSGTLNYVLTRIVTGWMCDDANYVTMNEAVGALECAKLELYRRVLAPYEDQKRKENGDVY